MPHEYVTWHACAHRNDPDIQLHVYINSNWQPSLMRWLQLRFDFDSIAIRRLQFDSATTIRRPTIRL